MIKPAALRAAIEASFPVLAGNPDALRMWIDRGGIACRATANDAFEISYTLNLVVVEWQGLPTGLFLVINRWLRANQPDLVAPGQPPAYTFEADIIDAATMDLAIELALTEAVAVTPRIGGGFDLQHLAEPAPMFPGEMALSTPPAPLAEVWWQGERLIDGPPLP